MALFYLTELKDQKDKYGLHYKDQVILKCDEEDKKAINELAQQLNMIYVEQEISIKAATKMIEYYQELILKTLTDKLDDIDNMYAMKKMLTETTKEMEKIITRLTQLQKTQNEEEKEE